MIRNKPKTSFEAEREKDPYYLMSPNERFHAWMMNNSEEYRREEKIKRRVNLIATILAILSLPFIFLGVLFQLACIGIMINVIKKYLKE